MVPMFKCGFFECRFSEPENWRSGATTGAWPGINPFGGWKASGAPGPAALGPDYLLNFLREQSRTVNGF